MEDNHALGVELRIRREETDVADAHLISYEADIDSLKLKLSESYEDFTAYKRSTEVWEADRIRELERDLCVLKQEQESKVEGRGRESAPECATSALAATAAPADTSIMNSRRFFDDLAVKLAGNVHPQEDVSAAKAWKFLTAVDMSRQEAAGSEGCVIADEGDEGDFFDAEDEGEWFQQECGSWSDVVEEEAEEEGDEGEHKLFGLSEDLGIGKMVILENEVVVDGVISYQWLEEPLDSTIRGAQAEEAQTSWSMQPPATAEVAKLTEHESILIDAESTSSSGAEDLEGAEAAIARLLYSYASSSDSEECEVALDRCMAENIDETFITSASPSSASSITAKMTMISEQSSSARKSSSSGECEGALDLCLADGNAADETFITARTLAASEAFLGSAADSSVTQSTIGQADNIANSFVYKMQNTSDATSPGFIGTPSYDARSSRFSKISPHASVTSHTTTASSALSPSASPALTPNSPVCEDLLGPNIVVRRGKEDDDKPPSSTSTPYSESVSSDVNTGLSMLLVEFTVNSPSDSAPASIITGSSDDEDFPRYGPSTEREAWFDSSEESRSQSSDEATPTGSDSAHEAFRAQEGLRDPSELPARLLFEAQLQREQYEALESDDLKQSATDAAACRTQLEHEMETTQNEVELRTAINAARTAINAAELVQKQLVVPNMALTEAKNQAGALRLELVRVKKQVQETKFLHEEERMEAQAMWSQHDQEAQKAKREMQEMCMATQAAEKRVVEMELFVEEESRRGMCELEKVEALKEVVECRLRDEPTALRAEGSEGETRHAVELLRVETNHNAAMCVLRDELSELREEALRRAADSEDAERAKTAESVLLKLRRQELDAMHAKELADAANQVLEWEEAWSSERLRFKEVNQLISEGQATLEHERAMFESEMRLWEVGKEQGEEALQADHQRSMKQCREELEQEISELHDQLRMGDEERSMLKSQLKASHRSGEAYKKRFLEAGVQLQDSERRRIREVSEEETLTEVTEKQGRDMLDAFREESAKRKKEIEHEAEREAALTQRLHVEELESAEQKHRELAELCESVRARCAEEVRRRRQVEEDLDLERQELRDALQALHEQQEKISLLSERDATRMQELVEQRERGWQAIHTVPKASDDEGLREELNVARTEAWEATKRADRREEKYTQLKIEVRDVIGRAKADNDARHYAEECAQTLREEVTAYKEKQAREHRFHVDADDALDSALRTSKRKTESQAETIEWLQSTLESERRIVQQLKSTLALRKYQLFGETVG
jgi:hypothetical protein